MPAGQVLLSTAAAQEDRTTPALDSIPGKIPSSFSTRSTMSKRTQLLVVGLICFLTGALTMHLPFVHAQDDKGKVPVWRHGIELRVRKSGETEFGKDTKRYGIEVFQDENNGNLIYLSETGSIAVVPATK
jgi:hypothetical protein